MVFYGLTTNSASELRAIEHQIAELQRQRETLAPQRNFQNEYGLSTLAQGLGNLITQSILSSQYVLSCIHQYLSREWTQPAAHALSPIVQEYERLPLAATELKLAIARRFPLEQRLTGVLLATTVVCASSLTPSPAGLLVAAGRVVGTFGGLSFVVLPEVSQRVASSFLMDWM